MPRPRLLLAAYFRRQARIRRGAIANAQNDIRDWQRQVAEFEAAADAAVDDGVNLMKEIR